ncbi:MAG: hypothetical protein ACREU8_01175, partial [Gammaproteobacteria bacterium]
LAYLPDMSRDSLRGFAHLGLLVTLLQSFLSRRARRIVGDWEALYNSTPRAAPAERKSLASG